ncbi:hypothetical protein [Streptomyces catenulae]|uniref:Uncharacterized protein n=1 Tax=Streptomyces catenulae TaxID=66875 RepID=A0ABV2Z2I0_9ACTN|nr:hypothetical protein [Streptomyces catenulae]
MSENRDEMYPPFTAKALMAGLRAAGIDPQEVSITPSGVLTVRHLSGGQIEAITERLHPDLLPLVTGLREALAAHGIHVMPTAEHGRILLGSYSIPQVDALTAALGGTPLPELSGTETPGWEGSDKVCRALEAASRSAIGHRLHGDLHPYCVACDRDARLQFLPVPPDVAHQLTDVLNRRSPQSCTRP